MQIRGTLHITVDKVDIEQTLLLSPDKCDGMPAAIVAMIAARGKQDFIRIWNILNKNHQTLEYDLSEKEGDNWHVMFMIRDKTKEELAA